ncbi:hypothetical protein BT96DRAFT_1010128 [Gymnopus androsaceus JB14]|uniref:Uncharacterized protein n=1 Tax=Gymnopus androsaceus JB14 TaxID=1447944 RepID=A0A6A4GB61_9AGAR|nr:hypothetical protein BT96DRAFT_1010128 [Gymnopus androsaceus JB14]
MLQKEEPVEVDDRGTAAEARSSTIFRYSGKNIAAIRLRSHAGINISKAHTHFLMITLKRNLSSSNPLTLYSLIDADVLPLSILDTELSKASHVESPEKVEGVPHPVALRIDLLRKDEQQRLTAGSLGSVLLVSVELTEDEMHKSPAQAVLDPVGHFTLWVYSGYTREANTKSRLVIKPFLPKQVWKLCLKNALDGNAYAMRVQPRPC